MKIAIDSGPTTSGHAVRGVGFYTKNLIEALGKNVESIDVETADLSKYNLIHIPHFNPFINTFPNEVENYKYVVTIHDLIPLLYPKHYVPGIKGKIRFYFQKLKAQRADAIITDSETSKKDIVRFLNIDPQKVHVIYLAPQGGLKKMNSWELENIRRKYKLPRKYVLYVGDINYNKNTANLIKACKYAQLPLVIIGKQATQINDLSQDIKSLKGPSDWLRYVLGKPHPEVAHYKNIIEALKDNKDVYRLGFVTVEEFSGIMQIASVYCQPSFYEGFGLVVLEAFSMQVPVVAAKTQALVEIGGNACLYVDPHDYKEMGTLLKKVTTDQKLTNDLIEKGQDRLKNFSWSKAAKETLNVYKMVEGK